ncbi:MAG: hypothetical protein ACKKMO_01015 [Candidatus Nealsonbacteria bacterium]
MELDVTIIDKLKGLLSKIISLGKKISLFVVVQQEDSNTWDLVIGGNKLDTKGNLDLITANIKKIFEKNEIVLFSRLILLNSDHSFLNSINRAFAIENGSLKIENTRIDNVLIKNAYLFYSKSIDYTGPERKQEVIEENVKVKDTTTSSTAQKNIDIGGKY